MIYFNKKIDFIIANSIDYYGIVLLTIFFVPVLIYFFNKICFKFNIILASLNQLSLLSFSKSLNISP